MAGCALWFCFVQYRYGSFLAFYSTHICTYVLYSTVHKGKVCFEIFSFWLTGDDWDSLSKG